MDGDIDGSAGSRPQNIAEIDVPSGTEELVLDCEGGDLSQFRVEKGGGLLRQQPPAKLADEN